MIRSFIGKARQLAGRVRVRLMLLVLIAVVPAFGLIVYSAIEQRRMATQAALHEAMRLAKSGAATHERMLEGAQQLLITLSQLDEVRALDASACGVVFSNVLRGQPMYANLGLIDRNGGLLATLVPTVESNRADRPYFREVTNRLDFSIGSYRISPTLGKPIVSLGYPVRDISNQLVGVVYAGLDLSWLKGVVTNLNLPPKSSLTVVNGERVTLLRHPDPEHRFTGRPLEQFYRNIRTNAVRIPQQGMMFNGPRLSRDGVWRLYALAPLQTGTAKSPESSATIAVGLPLDAAYANANRALARNVILLALVGGLTLVAAWQGADLFVLRRVRGLVQAAQALKAGKLGARTGGHPNRGELGQLASAFDAMADSLQQRVSERERAQAELREANRTLEDLNRDLERRVRIRTDELKRSNEELEAFAHVISDDLQEPLGMITSRMEMLKQHSADAVEGPGKDFVAFAVDGATRMRTLIEDLLAYARVDSQVKPHEPVPANQVVDAALQNLTVAIQEVQANIKRGPLPVVLGDRGQLTQLFQNLIANGLKFRKPGESPEITISAASEQGNGDSTTAHGQRFVRFSVADNGIGIAPEHFERIFLIFQRLHTRTQYPGTGIGLSICKKIVERHGGRIWVESTAGEGTTFHFTLPAT